jgi:hypothetical protein
VFLLICHWQGKTKRFKPEEISAMVSGWKATALLFQDQMLELAVLMYLLLCCSGAGQNARGES